MSNEYLRAALDQAGITQEQLADQIQVDVRTVRRWLAGGVPHARQRSSVARALQRDQVDLWPDVALEPERRPAPASDLIAGYTSASDPGAPGWQDLLGDAQARVDLLGQTLRQVIDSPGAVDRLATKAQQGCTVRMLIGKAPPALAALAGRAGIEIRVVDDGVGHTIYRFDDQLQLILHLYTGDAQKPPPMLHLSRRGPAGLFDAVQRHYELTWENLARPLDPETDIQVPKLAARQPTEAAPVQPGARRWPRRPPTSRA